jgi:uncharacterized protein YndB with AHSA1/START domain
MSQPHHESVVIQASADDVWAGLTRPERMREWMGEPEMALEIHADWRVGGPLVVRGMHHGRFENRGAVLAFEPGRRLSYTHLSSVSRLPDEPGSYTTLDFRLVPDGGGTCLDLTMHGFPTDSIRRHLVFYWSVTLMVLKRYVEGRPAYPPER